MASRHRDIVDQENKKAAKGLLKKDAISKRPALNELGNKLNTAGNAFKKVTETTKDAKAKLPAKKPQSKVSKSYSAQQLDVDPDANSINNPQMVTEYINDIYDYLRELEVKIPIREKFLVGHQSTPSMRAKLVNWLVEVHKHFELCLETLYVCVSILDRYLQENTNVGCETLQLVGSAALMIACKYEELHARDISDFVYICDNTFTKRQILKMEVEILNKLDHNLSRPLAIHFLRRYSRIAGVKMEQHTLSKYLLELALLDDTMSHIRPSIQAAAACCLSISILNDVSCPSKVWTPTLVEYTTYEYADFKDVVAKFAKLIIGTRDSNNKSIRIKYASSKFAKISINSKLRGNFVKRLAHQLTLSQ